ncbi:MAG TPA: AAA family ATPase [Myxococcota bacterium]|nr:AAA family ATPase [Myxococcota bacterium]HRY92213.1 AAA family ATPase [Myxococcota bacterium]
MIVDGHRHADLLRVAGQLRRANVRPDLIAAALAGINERCCSPSEDSTEVERLAKSVLNYPPGTDPGVVLGDKPRGFAASISARDFLKRNLPPKSWLIEGWFPANAFIVLFAPPKSFKSMLVIASMLALADGNSNSGVFHCSKPKRVLYVQVEIGPSSFQDRVIRHKRGLGVSDEALDRIRLLTPLPDGGFLPKLDDPEGLAHIRAAIEDFEPELVVFDPLARLHRADENNATEMAPIMDTFLEIRDTFKCSVAAIHHATKAARGRPDIYTARGSSAITGAVDSVICVSRDDHRLPVIEVSGNHRDFGDTGPFALRFVHDDEDQTMGFEMLSAAELHAEKRAPRTSREAEAVERALRDLGGTANRSALASKVGRGVAERGLRHLEELGMVEEDKRTRKNNARIYQLRETELDDEVGDDDLARGNFDEIPE